MSQDAAPESVHHPLFARLYARISPGMEAQGLAEHRQRLLAGLSGRVIEVGAGNGLNFRHYPARVTSILAVEPEPHLRSLASQAARDALVPVTVVDGVAGQLPADDAGFDAGVAVATPAATPSPPSPPPASSSTTTNGSDSPTAACPSRPRHLIGTAHRPDRPPRSNHKCTEAERGSCPGRAPAGSLTARELGSSSIRALTRQDGKSSLTVSGDLPGCGARRPR
jgi:methyltransferase family protein